MQKEPSKTQVLTVTTHNPDAKEWEEDQPMKVSHYDWNWIHEKWLNDMMREQLGETKDIGQLDFPNITTTPQLQQTRKIHPAPTRAFRVRYDVQLKVQESTDPVAEARLRLMELLQKIQEVDRHVVIYPWVDAGRQSREPAINDPKAIPTLLSNMKKYAYRMTIRQNGGLVYPQVFFGFMDPPDKIMENIGWWLCSMEQGMWKTQLQQAKEMTGLGLLLFLDDEFNKEVLKAQIWETTGVHVALRYQAIDNGVTKRDASNQKRVKAIHIKVDKSDPATSQNRLERLYSSATTTFPLGIKWDLCANFDYWQTWMPRPKPQASEPCSKDS